MFRRRLRARYSAVLSLLVCGVTAFLAGPAFADDPKTPQMVQYEALAKEFVQLRDVDSKLLGPQELLAAAEALEGKVRTLVDSAAGDPSAKSKAQELLSFVCDFAGDAPAARLAYSQFLDVLEGWQGKDYAVMVVRRAGDRMLEEENGSKSLLYYDLLLEKYPDHPSKAHALYQSGLACIETKAYTEATKRFDETVAAEPGGYYAPWALRKKAYALAEMVPAEGDFSASLAVLDELAQKYPTPHWKAYAGFRKGYTLARQQKYLEAIAEYTKGINEDPSSPYSEMGKKHIELIKKILDQQVLDQMAREKGKSPGTASVKPAGPVSMVLPDTQNRLGEGRP